MDDVTLSFTACREAIPDPDFYGECIRKSFEDHMQAVKVLEKRRKAQATTKTVPAAKKPPVKPSSSNTSKTIN